ncbi:hypothetical protein B0T09DRAFT_358257 [Sordaria sp. MPI-SDFR-AT-0083]|nr:hypothetical protein B0T09DRAFT_358257 [Sordaria sp. MPI-SDFR-AT-0083]
MAAAAFQNLDELRSQMDPYAHIDRWAETLDKNAQKPQQPTSEPTNTTLWPLIDLSEDITVQSSYFPVFRKNNKMIKTTITRDDGHIIKEERVQLHGRGIVEANRRRGNKNNSKYPKPTAKTIHDQEGRYYDADGNFRLPKPVYLDSRPPVRYPAPQCTATAWLNRRPDLMELEWERERER